MQKTSLSFSSWGPIALVAAAMMAFVGCGGSGAETSKGTGGSGNGGAGNGGAAGAGGEAGGGSGGNAGGGNGGNGGGGGAALCSVPKLASVEHGPAMTRPFSLHNIDTAAHPLALCNDGSAPAYIVRPGTGAGANRWLIHLDGGGLCFDLASCMERWTADDKPIGRKNMGSSGYNAQWLANETFGGVLADDPKENPLFHDATQVEIFYCSSDVWSGDKAAVAGASDTTQWHFRGREILKAAIQELLAMGLSNATEVVLSGSSAGGYGVYNNADDVGQMLPQKPRYVAMPDAGFFIDHPAYDPVTKMASTADPSLIQSMINVGVVTWGGRGDASCDALSPLDCRGPEFMVTKDYITTPLFIQNSQLDNNQLNRLGMKVNPVTGVAATPEEQVYADAFSAHMRQRLAGADTRHSMFARLDGFHVAIGVPTGKPNSFDVAKIGSTLLSSYMTEWYLDPCSSHRLVEMPNP